MEANPRFGAVYYDSTGGGGRRESGGVGGRRDSGGVSGRRRDSGGGGGGRRDSIGPSRSLAVDEGTVRQKRSSIAGRASLADTNAPTAVQDNVIRRTDTHRARQAQDAQGLNRALRRIVSSPGVMLLCLIGVLALGSGMVRPLAKEARARSRGVWISATCLIEAYELTALYRYVGKSSNVDSRIHLGAQVWTFHGSLNVTVTLADGCDGRPERTPGLLDSGSNDSSLRDARWLQAVASSGRANRGAEGANSSDQRTRPNPCATRETRLDFLRGSHMASSSLVLSNSDQCVGPINASYDEGKAYCSARLGLWWHNRPEVEESAPCWAFARGQSDVQIVMTRKLSPSVSFFVLYFTCALMLAARVVWLIGRRWLQICGYVSPDELEPRALGSGGDPRLAPATRSKMARRSYEEDQFGNAITANHPSKLADGWQPEGNSLPGSTFLPRWGGPRNTHGKRADEVFLM